VTSGPDSGVSDDAVMRFAAARKLWPRWIDVPQAHRPLTIDAGYAVQAGVHAFLVGQGDRLVGYKVGSTSAIGQAALGLSEPIYAGLFESTRANSLREAITRPFAAPSIECEIAFLLAEDIDATRAGAGRLLSSVASCHLACEIIDNRYGAPLDVGIPTLLGDDFFHAGFVLGPANADWRSLDLERLHARVSLDGTEFRGKTAEVLAAPAALAWLVEAIIRRGGRLNAGDLVLTGAIVPPVRFRKPPQDLALRVEGFAPLVLDAP
jgi:2-keto-4-pentenoate hydratase